MKFLISSPLSEDFLATVLVVMSKKARKHQKSQIRNKYTTKINTHTGYTALLKDNV